jgi:hypothetical protein
MASCVEESAAVSTSEGSAGTSGEDSDAVDDPTVDTTGEPVPEFVPYPARGITLTEVTANQGVSVPIVGPTGQWVDGSGRNAELVADRNTLIRGLWELEPGYEPREIEAVLTLSYPDGTEEIAKKRILVEGPSELTNLDTNVYFWVPGELIAPQVKFQIELFETEVGYEDLPEPSITAYPSSPGYIGIENTPMELQVVLVPVKHDLGDDCPDAPEITEEAAAYLADALFEQNPVQFVDVTVRDVFVYDQSMRSFGGLLGTLATLRETDGAPPEAYYYGLVRPCDGGPDGVGGQAISIPSFPSKDNAWTRTSVGRWYGSLSSTASTFVHEVGHTQGRRHIACNGTERGTDPSYPYEGGTIGVWGFGVLRGTLHTPTHAKDYMTYCGNTWVSDWGWRAVVPFIKEITSWSYEGSAPEPTPGARLLVGLFDEDAGEHSWFLTHGTTGARAANPADVFELVAADGSSRWLPSSLAAMGEGGYNVAVELPDDVVLDASLAITRWRGHDAHPVHEIAVAGRSLSLKH